MNIFRKKNSYEPRVGDTLDNGKVKLVLKSISGKIVRYIATGMPTQMVIDLDTWKSWREGRKLTRAS